MNKQDKTNKNTYLIASNPNESATKLYERSKSAGIGMRKTDFLALVRSVRHLPEKTPEVKQKYVPTKYKNKPQILVKEKIHTNKDIKKKTQYGLAEVDAIDNDEGVKTFYIKYKNKKDFNRQLDVILQHYNIKSYSIYNYGVHYYKPFIDQGFQTQLDAWKIKLI